MRCVVAAAVVKAGPSVVPSAATVRDTHVQGSVNLDQFISVMLS
jgi:hypothetical protein